MALICSGVVEPKGRLMLAPCGLVLLGEIYIWVMILRGATIRKIQGMVRQCAISGRIDILKVYGIIGLGPEIVYI
jgi:hypothetical protein